MYVNLQIHAVPHLSIESTFLKYSCRVHVAASLLSRMHNLTNNQLNTGEVEVFVVPLKMPLGQLDGCTFRTLGGLDGEYLSIAERRVVETERFKVCRCLKGWHGKNCTTPICEKDICNANSKCQVVCTGGKWLNMKGFPVSLKKCMVIPVLC